MDRLHGLIECSLKPYLNRAKSTCHEWGFDRTYPTFPCCTREASFLPHFFYARMRLSERVLGRHKRSGGRPERRHQSVLSYPSWRVGLGAVGWQAVQ